MKLANTIEDVFPLLDEIIAEALYTGSKIGLFAVVFRQTAFKIQMAIAQGEFADPVRMAQLMVQLTNRYLSALYGFKAGTSITKSWELAFLGTQRTDLIIVQHLLLGGNAHLNLDLAVATALVTPSEQLKDFAPDFEKINLILAEVFDLVQEVINPVYPLLKRVDELGKTYDEMLINFSVKQAREIAWENAKQLAYGTTNQQIRIIKRIDKKTRILGQLIISSPQLLTKIIPSSSEEQEIVIATLEAINKIFSNPLTTEQPVINNQLGLLESASLKVLFS